MESDRHVFMRKLLRLCIDTGCEFHSYEALSVDKVGEDGAEWISSLCVSVKDKRAFGYWDGERHEVQL